MERCRVHLPRTAPLGGALRSGVAGAVEAGGGGARRVREGDHVEDGDVPAGAPHFLPREGGVRGVGGGGGGGEEQEQQHGG